MRSTNTSSNAQQHLHQLIQQLLRNAEEDLQSRGLLLKNPNARTSPVSSCRPRVSVFLPSYDIAEGSSTQNPKSKSKAKAKKAVTSAKKRPRTAHSDGEDGESDFEIPAPTRKRLKPTTPSEPGRIPPANRSQGMRSSRMLPDLDAADDDDDDVGALRSAADGISVTSKSKGKAVHKTSEYNFFFLR